MRKKYIEYEQFRDAVMLGVEKWLQTDISDYDNWQGIREMARFMWNSLDRRVYGQRWLKLLSPVKIQERIDEAVQDKYKKIFGRIYWKKSLVPIEEKL